MLSCPFTSKLLHKMSRSDQWYVMLVNKNFEARLFPVLHNNLYKALQIQYHAGVPQPLQAGFLRLTLCLSTSVNLYEREKLWLNQNYSDFFFYAKKDTSLLWSLSPRLSNIVMFQQNRAVAECDCNAIMAYLQCQHLQKIVIQLYYWGVYDTTHLYYHSLLSFWRAFWHIIFMFHRSN